AFFGARNIDITQGSLSAPCRVYRKYIERGPGALSIYHVTPGSAYECRRKCQSASCRSKPIAHLGCYIHSVLVDGTPTHLQPVLPPHVLPVRVAAHLNDPHADQCIQRRFDIRKPAGAVVDPTRLLDTFQDLLHFRDVGPPVIMLFAPHHGAAGVVADGDLSAGVGRVELDSPESFIVPDAVLPGS